MIELGYYNFIIIISITFIQAAHDLKICTVDNVKQFLVIK